MSKNYKTPLSLSVETERWPLVAPFRITGHAWNSIESLLVLIERDGEIGQGEAAGVFYKGESVSGMREQIEGVRSKIEAGITLDSLQDLLPPGGARNALDCALWTPVSHPNRSR